MEYVIEVSMQPAFHDSPIAPYFWCLLGITEDGSRCNYGHGWGKTPNDAWKKAIEYYDFWRSAPCN